MDWNKLNDEQLREAYHEKAKALSALFEEHGLNMNDEQVSEVQQLNKTLAEIKQIQERRAKLQEAKSAADEALAEGAEGEPETKATHPGAGRRSGSDEFKSIGQLFLESNAFKQFDRMSKQGPTSDVEVENLAKALHYSEMAAKTLFTTDDYPSEDQRLPGLRVPFMRRRPVVADLIPQAGTTSKTISYVEENAGTNAADFVAEGALKPESALSFTEKTITVTKLATWLPITDEAMEDEPFLRGVIDSRLRLFLQLREEEALLDGSGVAPEFGGMLNTVGIQTQAVGGDPVPDAIYKAMVLIQLNAKFQPDGIIMHPNDWQDVRLLRTPDGQYIWGSPAEAGNIERIWGLPVVSTEAATENTAIVAAFQAATQIFRRSGIAFAVSDSHSDYFIRNQMAIRAEERLAFVVYRPAAICTVTGV